MVFIIKIIAPTKTVGTRVCTSSMRHLDNKADRNKQWPKRTMRRTFQIMLSCFNFLNRYKINFKSQYYDSYSQKKSTTVCHLSKQVLNGLHQFSTFSSIQTITSKRTIYFSFQNTHFFHSLQMLRNC